MQPTASLPRRLFALIYEVLLLFALLFMGFLLPFTLLGWAAKSLPVPWVEWLWCLTLMGVYFVWQWSHGGQTLSMKTWHIRLVGEAGETVNWQVAFLRYVIACFSTLLCGIGFLWALVDKEGQFLHDRLSRTRLIGLPK